MTTLRVGVRETLTTWMILGVSVLMSSLIYVLLMKAGFADQHALFLAGSILFALIVTGRMFSPKDLDVASWPALGDTSQDRLRNVFRSTDGLRVAYRNLELEGVKHFRFEDPRGKTALLLRIPARTTGSVMFSQITPYLGAEPLTYQTVVIADDEALVLATFAQHISQSALDRVREMATVERLSKKEATRVYSFTKEQWAAYAAAA